MTRPRPTSPPDYRRLVETALANANTASSGSGARAVAYAVLAVADRLDQLLTLEQQAAR
jgi:hypothetical protein